MGQRSLLASTILAVSLGFGLGSPAKAQLSPQVPIPLPRAQEEPVAPLGGQLNESVAATQADPAIPEILEALDLNISAIGQIRQMVEALSAEGPIGVPQVQEIRERFATIAQSFRTIADLAPEVFTRRQDELRDIKTIGDRIGFNIARVLAEIESLTRANEEIARQVASPNLPPLELEKLEFTRTVNASIVQNLETSVRWWNTFADVHGDLVASLDSQTEKLDVFFHFLRENARLYESVSDTLGVAGEITVALSDLETMRDVIGRLDEIQSDLITSWQEVTTIMDQVNRQLELRMSPGM
ncbi:MAG: hypothetical protein IT535_05085 [Bauldia sp.]|nr:hypothetical protein [Bauldia sp.]